MDADKVRQQAEEELQEELFRIAVDKEKERIRNKKKSWFPWRIQIININERIK